MFDMLLESGQRSSSGPSWGKGVALTLHMLVLGALWRAPTPPAPDIPIVISDDFPDQPPPDRATPTSAPAAPRPLIDGDWVVVPAPDIPDIVGSTLRTPLVEIRGAVAPVGSTTFGSGDDVVPISLVQDPPELLMAPTPVYPALLRAAGVQGRVIVAAVVDTLGQAEAGSVRIVLSDNPGFDAAALATIRAARFRPARMYGRAVRVLVRVPVVFRLS